MIKKFLDNGLSVYFYPIDNAYSTTIGLYVNSGSKKELPEQNGITHLLEHLYFRKLGDLSQSELYKKMDEMGAELKASTHKELLRFYMKFRPKYFTRALNIVKKIILTDKWTKEELEAEKKVVFNELYEQESRLYYEGITDSVIWKSHPLAMPVIGNEKTLKRMTLDDILIYKEKIFAKQNICLLVTGNISEEMMSNCEAVMGDIKLCDNIEKFRDNKIILGDRNPDICMVDSKWDYVDIDLCFDLVKSINRYELILLNSILGGGTGSRLQCYLREQLGLTSNVHSYLETYTDAGIIHIFMSTHKNNVLKCIEAVTDVLRLMKSNIASVDMNTNMPYFTDNLWYRMEDSEKLNLELGWELFQDIEPYTIEEEIKMYNRITKEDLMNLSKVIFTPQNTSLIIMGSTNNTTKKQLERILQNL